jgi:hypothetical protein
MSTSYDIDGSHTHRTQQGLVNAPFTKVVAYHRLSRWRESWSPVHNGFGTSAQRVT